jgi:AraC family transcriptional regulator of arabinose operon
MSAHRLSVEEWQRLARERDFHLEKIARAHSVTLRQMERIFQRDFGTTPERWLRQLQCRLARELLLQGFSNKEIADRLRFANQFHFCREFKKVFGIPPQTFASVLQNLPAMGSDGGSDGKNVVFR